MQATAGIPKETLPRERLFPGADKTAGLHNESRELLARVIALNTDHEGARRLLGYYRLGTEWKQAPTLSIAIVTKASTANQEILRAQLSIVAQARQDFTVVSDLRGVSPPNVCELTIDLVTSNRSGTTFYGQSVSDPTSSASVTLKPKAEWLGTKPVKLVLNGEVSAFVPRASEMAVIDAFTRSSAALHAFIDDVMQARMKLFDPPSTTKASAPPPKTKR